jgi:hypothetical protein
LGGNLDCFRSHAAGMAVALRRTSHTVFRTAFAAVVLILALGQNTDLLCAWSHAVAPGMGGCVREQSNSSSLAIVAGDDCTRDTALVTFIREEGRRGSSAVEPLASSTLHAFQLAPARTLPRSLSAREQCAPAIQPRSSPLRI